MGGWSLFTRSFSYRVGVVMRRVKDCRYFLVTGPVTTEISLTRADELVPMFEIFHTETTGRYHVSEHGNDFYLTARY